jgi:hypothetical protein
MSPTNNTWPARRKQQTAGVKNMRAWRQPLALLAVIALAGACIEQAAQADTPTREQGRWQQSVEEPMKIRVITVDQTFTAVLEDSDAARDFAALLPIELPLKDYNRTEKIADLPKRLSTKGAPEGIDPAVGDITYYAPWGNLAIFYRDFGYSRGLVRLGRLEGGVESMAKIDGLVRIETIP